MNKINLYLEDEEDIYNEEYQKEIFSNIEIHNKSIVNTKFDKCDLTTSTYENIYFEKTIFNNCDLSNINFIDCTDGKIAKS